MQTLAPSTIRCVQAWIEAAGLRSGPLFCSLRRDGHCTKERLSARSIWNIIADHAADAGAEDRPHVRPDPWGGSVDGGADLFQRVGYRSAAHRGHSCCAQPPRTFGVADHPSRAPILCGARGRSGGRAKELPGEPPNQQRVMYRTTGSRQWRRWKSGGSQAISASHCRAASRWQRRLVSGRWRSWLVTFIGRSGATRERSTRCPCAARLWKLKCARGMS